jgi:hypothetical protein
VRRTDLTLATEDHNTPTGYAELVEGVIERLEVHDGEQPLAWLHGRYVSVEEPEDRP